MARAYRKKPVVVEAVQWTGENHAEMCEFIDPEVFEIIPRVGLVIHTLEGDHHASPGDYIIKGVNGEFYPCKPDIFAKTYESAALTPPNEWVSVEERLPESQTPVLAVLQSKTFSKYITISVLAHIGYHEVNTEDDFGWREYEGETEYDEKKDCFWVHPCWYEVNAVDDNPNWEVDDVYEVTHWMPLPESPKEELKK